jgi:quinol monooxygenase YgiN
MIHVLATIRLHPGQRAAFLQELRALVPLVRAEEGCLEYSPATDIETNLPTSAAVRDDVVVIVERWTDMAALEAHLIAPHMLAYRPKVRDLVDHVELQILSPVV